MFEEHCTVHTPPSFFSFVRLSSSGTSQCSTLSSLSKFIASEIKMLAHDAILFLFLLIYTSCSSFVRKLYLHSKAFLKCFIYCVKEQGVWRRLKVGQIWDMWHRWRVLLAVVALWFSLPRAPLSRSRRWYSYWPARQDRPVEELAWPGLVARIQI